MCCFYEAKTIKLDNSEVRVEQTGVEIASLRSRFAGETCPMCGGLGRLRCCACRGGRVPFLGGLQECSQCKGVGLKPCPCCATRGVLPAEALAA